MTAGLVSPPDLRATVGRVVFGLSVMFITFTAFAVVPPQAGAQTGAARPSPADLDSVFARARQLVVNGNGAAGRALVDSVVATTDPDTPAYAEALYWRATLAATSADAERDYRRIVVDYPLSPREGDALLQLAQLEVARGDRASAGGHLERFLLENPNSSEQARAELLLVRVSFEQNDLPRGCIALHRALSTVPPSAVELHNQLTYYSPRCVGVDTTRTAQTAAAPAAAAVPAAPIAAPGTAAARRDTTRRDTTRRDTTRKDTGAARGAKPPSAGRYTLQVAAYSTKAEAERLVKRLQARDIDARVAGSSKPFRVRIGRYDTHADALAAAKTLKAKKIDAFVTGVGADDP